MLFRSARAHVSEHATAGGALAVALAFMLLVAYHAEKARAATPGPATTGGELPE